MPALENHWGLTTRPETLLALYQKVRSPWLGINLDTGNFPGEPYAGLELLAPHAVFVQAKTYYGGGEWYTLDLDYPRIAGMGKTSPARVTYPGLRYVNLDAVEDRRALPSSTRRRRRRRSSRR